MRYTKDELIKELRRVWEVLGKKPYSQAAFQEVSDIHPRTIERNFDGWNAALGAARLDFQEAKEKVKQERKSFDPEAHVIEQWEEEKAQLIERAEERKNKWLRQQVFKINLLREMLEEVIAKAEPPVVEVKVVKVESVKGAKKPHCTLWFEFSDLQLGTIMTAEEMGGLNKHNWVIWKDKLKVWTTEAITRIAGYAKDYAIDQVIISCGGDMVEGVDIFKGQAWQVDRHVVDQAIYGANDCAQALAEICLSFPDLQFHILEVFGNHGRIGHKGENPYSCSMDKVFQRFLASQLNACGIKNLQYHENEAWFYLVEIYGWNHLILHGDQGLGGLWSNRPTVNGLEKGVTRYNQMLQQQIHFVHVGHFHNDAQMSFNMSQILINGSFVGTSTFSAHTMVASSPPVQCMHVFEPRVGLSRTERIYLARGDVRQVVEPNTLKAKRK